ncbi:hypothetical protein KZ813_00225 [Sphingomonas sp. RHCKR7]|uniref:hypothetical protein n=1 Tax=Sphingomonas folli TaxID=2862497 RepID=UPI001CA4F2DF|nr:hypothetical protein [Sphingomonas folli]MBW6525261.1 hypothetical protein [Sphingomonas folli]
MTDQLRRGPGQPGWPSVCIFLAAPTLLVATSNVVAAQVADGDEHYSMEALKTEAADVGEKLACYLKIYRNATDRDFEAAYGKAYEYDLADFSKRVEGHISRFAPRKDALSLPIYRFNTWHTLNFFVDRKEGAVREAPDQTVMGRCNLLASTMIQRRRSQSIAPKVQPRRR